MMLRNTKFLLIVLAVILALSGVSTVIFAAPQTSSERINVLVGFTGKPDKLLIEKFNGKINRQFDFISAAAVELPLQAVNVLSKYPNVRFVEKDVAVFTTSQTIPWGIDRVFGGVTNRTNTWNQTKGSSVKVAVLDTGIDKNHEDLYLNIKGGHNTIDSTSWFVDGNGHGTHVAGTIAAADNTIGVVGVAPNVDLYAVKVISDSGSGTVSSLIAGIEWAINNKMNIINMSLGLGSHVQALQDAVDAAYNKHGLLIVASAGNSGNSSGTGDNVNYPARYPSVIAVASCTSRNSRSSFSSTGPTVELIAPGSDILSTIPGNKYASYNGTSMASPHVAGSAALVWAADPGLTNLQLRGILQSTAQDLSLKKEHQGYGLVRADQAVSKAIENKAPLMPELYTISGTVKDNKGNLINGAQVKIEDTSYETQTLSGDYSFKDISQGNYTITVSADGYDSESKTVENLSSNITLDFILEASATSEPINNHIYVNEITFTVKRYGPRGSNIDLTTTVEILDSTNVPVSGAKVAVELKNNKGSTWNYTATTDSNGKVSFTEKRVSTGEYTATVKDVTHNTLNWDQIQKTAKIVL
jgi:subtilisin